MGFYDSEENVERYIRMADGYDGKLLIDALGDFLPVGSRVLELGMGAGKDLLLLNERYQASGSDLSAVFVERFMGLYPNIDVKLLDAISIETDERYDGIYSNKALHHLRRAELRDSFNRQAQILESGGIALHSFWYGTDEGEHHDLRYVYYRQDTLKALIGCDFEVADTKRYTEIDADDSFYVVLRKR